MRGSSLVVPTAVLCTLITASVSLGAPTIIPGPVPGSVSGIDDLEVGSDIYDVTFQWGHALSVRAATPFFGDPTGAADAGFAINAVLNTAPVADLVYDPTSGGGGRYYILYQQDAAWRRSYCYSRMGDTWVWRYTTAAPTRTHPNRRWAVFAWTGTVSQPSGETPIPPDGVIPAPGALLLGSIGAGVVSWLRRRRTI